MKVLWNECQSLGSPEVAIANYFRGSRKSCKKNNNVLKIIQNIIYSKEVDKRGIEPMTSRMRSERSTPELHAHTLQVGTGHIYGKKI